MVLQVTMDAGNLDKIINETFTNLDAVQGLKQLELMRDTLTDLRERYTAWVRLQKKPPLDRTVREDKFEKEIRVLIHRGKASISTLYAEILRHRRLWDNVERCRMMDTTPLSEEDMDCLATAWQQKIQGAVKQRQVPTAAGGGVKGCVPRKRLELQALPNASQEENNKREQIVPRPPTREENDGKPCEEDVEDLIFSEMASKIRGADKADDRVIQPPAKRRKATMDPSEAMDAYP